MTAKQFYDWQTSGGTDDVMRLVESVDFASARLADHMTRNPVTLRPSQSLDEAMAVMLAVPVGTVKWRVFEARRKVRLELARLGLVDAG